MILNRVVSTSRQQFRDLSPLIPESRVSFNNDRVFLGRPFKLLHVRVKVIVPPFTTLLTYPARKSFGYPRPIAASKDGNLLMENSVFIYTPRPFYKSRVKNLLPTMKTLYISSVVKVACNVLPIPRTILLDQFAQLNIFVVTPELFARCSQDFLFLFQLRGGLSENIEIETYIKTLQLLPLSDSP